MSLIVEPSKVQISAAGGIVTHKLINKTNQRLAFKISSSNNENYRVKPVYGFVDPNSQTSIEFIRTGGPIKKDKFVIYYNDAKTDATNAKECFPSKTCKNEIKLPINLTK